MQLSLLTSILVAVKKPQLSSASLQFVKIVFSYNSLGWSQSSVTVRPLSFLDLEEKKETLQLETSKIKDVNSTVVLQYQIWC